MIEQAILHTDGGSRGNPGPSGIGYELLVDDGRGLTTISEGGAFIGEATNNVAEYQALIWGLGNAIALDVRKLDVRADSELLVKQIKGEYRVKSEGIRPLHRKAMALLETLESYSISHVYRADNARADALANEAMDAEGSVGGFQIACEVAVGAEAAPAQGSLFDEFTDGSDSYYPEHMDHVILSASEESSTTYGCPSERSEEAPQVCYAEQSEDTSSVSTSKAVRSTMTTTGIYSLTVKNHFDAAHALIGYPGECKNLHGHTWDIEATVSGTKLDEVGIVYDFKALKSNLTSILDAYDHHYLNEVPPFDTINATAENLARVIYEQLEQMLPPEITLDEVSVWESPIAKLTYRKV